jgi:hypothetical protein
MKRAGMQDVQENLKYMSVPRLVCKLQRLMGTHTGRHPGEFVRPLSFWIPATLILGGCDAIKKSSHSPVAVSGLRLVQDP